MAQRIILTYLNKYVENYAIPQISLPPIGAHLRLESMIEVNYYLKYFHIYQLKQLSPILQTYGDLYIISLELLQSLERLNFELRLGVEVLTSRIGSNPLISLKQIIGIVWSKC